MQAIGPAKPDTRGSLPPRPRRRASAWRAPRITRWRLPATAGSNAHALGHDRAQATKPMLVLLGTPKVRSTGTWHDLPPSRWLALLAYVARCGTWVRREALATLFWPEHDREHAYLNLRQTLQTIARSRAAAAFEREPARVRWTGATDVAAFEGHVRAGGWRDALATYGGPLLDGLELAEVTPAQEWLDAERRTLEDWWRTGALALAAEHLQGGRPLDALALADGLLRRDALDEAALRLGVEAAVAAGDRQRARRTFAAFRGHLLDELGMEPEPETLALTARLGVFDAS
jgi:DNA-binding SARP family transcriptional activator